MSEKVKFKSVREYINAAKDLRDIINNQLGGQINLLDTISWSSTNLNTLSQPLHMSLGNIIGLLEIFEKEHPWFSSYTDQSQATHKDWEFEYNKLTLYDKSVYMIICSSPRLGCQLSWLRDLLKNANCKHFDKSNPNYTDFTNKIINMSERIMRYEDDLYHIMTAQEALEDTTKKLNSKIEALTPANVIAVAVLAAFVGGIGNAYGNKLLEDYALIVSVMHYVLAILLSSAIVYWILYNKDQ